jgi:signal-transduction protein with cAMP-binding, CBS, and nucleotidyltransferase domain
MNRTTGENWFTITAKTVGLTISAGKVKAEPYRNLWLMSTGTATEKTGEALELLGDGASFQEELCAMIEKTQIFKELSRREVETLSYYVKAYKLGEGEIIFREGDKGTFMCFLVEGKIDVLKDDQDGRLKKLTTIRAGRTIGEMSLLDQMPHSATGIAAQPLRLVMLTRSALDKLNADHPGLANRLLWQISKLLSLRLRKTTGALADYIH